MSDTIRSGVFMRSPWVLFFFFLSLLGCQSLGTPDGPPGRGSGFNPSGTIQTINAVDKGQDQDWGSTQEIPQTIAGSPVLVSTTGFPCEPPYALCIGWVQVFNADKCKEGRIFILGKLRSTFSNTLFDKVEVKLEYPPNPPNESKTIRPQFLGQNPVGTLLLAKFETFLDVSPGQTIKITARRTDHPGEEPEIKELEYTGAPTDYQGSCFNFPSGAVPESPLRDADPGN